MAKTSAWYSAYRLPHSALVLMVTLIWGVGWHQQTPAVEGCARPSDENGPLYEEIKGLYLGQMRPNGVAAMAEIYPFGSASPVSVPVDDMVARQLEQVTRGTPVTLVGYVSNSLSGSQPPYTCMEISGDPPPFP